MTCWNGSGRGRPWKTVYERHRLWSADGTWGRPSAVDRLLRSASAVEAYAPLRAELEKQFAEGSVDSDPKLAAEALLRLVDSEEPPLRLLLGSMVYDLAFGMARERMDTCAAWEHVSRAAEQAIPAPEFTGEEAGGNQRHETR